MTVNKNTIIIIAGLIWGMTGFSIELVGGETAQSALRLVFIIISTIMMLSSIKIRISEEFYLGAAIMTLYITIYIVSNIIHHASINHIIRNIILYFILLILFVLLSHEKPLDNFIKGIFISLCILNLFYFINIDFSSIFLSNYRLYTELNPNGIGMMGNMLFIFLYYYLYTINNNISRILITLMLAICLAVIIATHSRTALLMLFFTFIFINVQLKKWLILAILFAIFFIIFITFYDEISSVLRLKDDVNYTGSKNITNLTGRTEVWAQGFKLIIDNFFLGVGSSNAYVMIDGHKGSFHNAFIQIFVEIGFLGLLPILTLLLIALLNIFTLKEGSIFKIVLLIGLAGSMTEDRLLNYGSPANLLYLMSFLYLTKVYMRRYTNASFTHSVS